MANTAVDLTTITTLKARLGLSSVVVSDADAAELARLVTESSTRLQSEIGDLVVYSARVDTKDGKGGTRLWLDHGLPGSSEATWSCVVTTVVIDGVTVPASATDGYVLVDKTRIDLKGSYTFTEGSGNVVITYTAGFKITPSWDIPSDIEGAVVELAALRWKEKDRIGQTSKNVAGEVTSFQGSNVWSTFLAVAAAYRRVVV